MKQVPVESLVSSCNDEILQNAPLIGKASDRVAFESEGVRNEYKADENKTMLIYHHMKIVLSLMMRGPIRCKGKMH